MNDLKDVTGTPYSSPDGKPAQSGVDITIHGPGGTHTPGKMIGPYATPNK
jgi:hypothetical protein